MNAFRGRGTYAGSRRIAFRPLGGDVCGEDASMANGGHEKPKSKGCSYGSTTGNDGRATSRYEAGIDSGRKEHKSTVGHDERSSRLQGIMGSCSSTKFQFTFEALIQMTHYSVDVSLSQISPWNNHRKTNP